MATGQTIIDRACRLLGVVPSGVSPTAAESADGLTALNALLDSWRNERLMVYSLTDVSKALTSGDNSYTIFPSTGDFDTPRPVEIRSAYMTIDGVDYPVRILTDAEWFAIEDKTTTGDLVECLWYNPAMSEGVVKVWPTPSAANTLHLVVWTPLTAIATLATTFTFPPGWERACVYNLAVELAPEFGADVPPAVARVANSSLALLKRRNAPTIKLFSGLAGLFGGHRYNIETGQ